MFLQTREMSGKDEGQKDLRVSQSDKENVLVVDSIWGMRFDNTNTTLVSGQGDCINRCTVYQGNKYRRNNLERRSTRFVWRNIKFMESSMQLRR